MFHNASLPRAVDAVAQWDVSHLLHRGSWVRSGVGEDGHGGRKMQEGSIGAMDNAYPINPKEKGSGALGYLFYAYWATSGAPEFSPSRYPPELKVVIFARRAMVDQARQGLCYQRET